MSYCYTDQDYLDEVYAEIVLLAKQRNDLIAALEVVTTNAEECMHFDELEGMFIPIEDYNRLMGVVSNLKGAE